MYLESTEDRNLAAAEREKRGPLAVVGAARRHGVPVWTADRWLEYVRKRIRDLFAAYQIELRSWLFADLSALLVDEAA